MAYATVRDNALWAKHIEDPAIVARILALRQDASVTLQIEGTRVQFLKMRDGADGRPTPGLRPADPAARQYWAAMQDRRGERVRIALESCADAEDRYLASLGAHLSEWDSPEDAEAYDQL